MRVKLTTKYVDTLQPADKVFKVFDADLTGFFIKVRPSGTMTYGLWYRVNGKAAEYTIGRHGAITPAQARDIAKRRLGEVANGKDVQAEKQQARRQQEAVKYQTLGSFLEQKYGPWVVEHRKTGAATLARLKACFADQIDKPLESINAWVIEKWRAAELKRGKRPATINRDLVALKAVLSKAVDWNVIDAHPLAKLKPLKVDNKGKVRYLLPDEEKRLRRALLDRETRIRTERASGNQWRAQRGYEPLPNLTQQPFVDHLQPIVLLALNTGLRRGELFNLHWEDVSLNSHTLTVRGDGAKSGETRHIPMNDEALDILTRWQAQRYSRQYVFPAEDGGRLDNIKKSFGNLLRLAEIENFRFHDLRHTFASKLVMAGVDLNTVRDLLGHQSLEMTLRYAHLAPEHKAAAVALLIT